MNVITFHCTAIVMIMGAAQMPLKLLASYNIHGMYLISKTPNCDSKTHRAPRNLDTEVGGPDWLLINHFSPLAFQKIKICKSKLSKWLEWLDLPSLRSSVKFVVLNGFAMITHNGGKESSCLQSGLKET